MNEHLPDRLIIFDYSGTLSLGAPAFARPERLREELEISGLAGLGIGTPERFWTGIVNPTWHDGSTTTVGYGAILRRRIRELSQATGHVPPDDRISRAARLFVDRYLSASPIDAGWRPLLQMLGGMSPVRLAIATDHYAEATGAILNFLGAWGIDAQGLAASGGPVPAGRVAVANSADLGAHKADRRFWEILRERLFPERHRHVLLIDDFGANEQEGDSYAEGRKVEERRRKTLDLLRAVFAADVRDFFFTLKTGSAFASQDRLMEAVSRTVRRWIDHASTGSGQE